MASTKGWPSMSPMVPPSSVMTTSALGLLLDAAEARLDGVGDVRDHLHGAAEEVARALALDERLVDEAGGEVGLAGEVLVDEALVVAEVEVGLLAVLGHEDLAVLEGAHGARVDVEVGSAFCIMTL
jgi:hypothetical protein